MRPRVVQRACVLMHFDECFARDIYAAGAAWLRDDELALLRAVDPRAFRTDPERPLRLLAGLLEEYPVSAAVVGVEALHAFIGSAPFRHAVLRDRLVADAFGDWLFARAGAIAHIELGRAMARRRRHRRGTGIARAPGVELARGPAGTLACYVDALARLGERAHDKVAAGARVDAPDAPAVSADDDAPGQEHILVVHGAVSLCSEPLFALLSWARDGKARDAVVHEAARLGADEDAAELVADLCDEGLIASV